MSEFEAFCTSEYGRILPSDMQQGLLRHFVINPVSLELVRNNGMKLEYVGATDRVHEICLAAVRQNGHALQHVKEQTREICLAAVRENGYALQLVKEQTHEICLAAVQQNGYALQFVKQQTPEICRAAIAQYSLARHFVKIHLD